MEAICVSVCCGLSNVTFVRKHTLTAEDDKDVKEKRGKDEGSVEGVIKKH